MLHAALFVGAALTLALVPSAHARPHEQVPRLESTVVPFDISLFKPVSIFSAVTPRTIAGLSLNILHGRSYEVYGLELGLIFNGVDRDLGGIQVSGIGSRVGNDSYAIQAAGIYNWVDGRCHGIQAAGIFNVCDGGAALQVAGGVNAAMGQFVGLQASFLGNVVSGSDFVVQASGIANIAIGDAFAVQAAFLANVIERGAGLQVGLLNNAPRGFTGIQAGLVNLDAMTLPVFEGFSCRSDGCGDAYSYTDYRGAVTRGLMLAVANRTARFDGVQIGALFNMADDVEGVQIGLVNVAKNLHGLQIGLVNVAASGGLPFMIGVNAGL